MQYSCSGKDEAVKKMAKDFHTGSILHQDRRWNDSDADGDCGGDRRNGGDDTGLWSNGVLEGVGWREPNLGPNGVIDLASVIRGIWYTAKPFAAGLEEEKSAAVYEII